MWYQNGVVFIVSKNAPCELNHLLKLVQLSSHQALIIVTGQYLKIMVDF